MLSLIRWGLGSGNDPLTEKERIKAVEKQRSPAAAPASRGKMMAAVSQNTTKRKRAAAPSSSAKQAKRHPGSNARSGHGDDAPRPLSQQETRQTFIDQLMASVHGVSPPFKPPTEAARPRPSVPAPAPATSTPPQQQEQQQQPSPPPSNSSVASPAQASEPPAAVAAVEAQPAAAPEPVDMDRVQQMIQEQFGLDILLKHRELRLIDQEIAKCQVALEQLRRCRAIPFPSQTGKPTDMLNVSGGVGQPIRTRHRRQPTQPTPWGIAEGPYTRHYAQWLVPDAAFDGGALEDYQLLSYRGVPKTAPLDRQTRGGRTDFAKGRSHRGLGGFGGDSARFQALPSGYPGTKEEKGIAILKRQSDGKMVKLYCAICNRDDFSSPQGFINHYRIAHDKNLKSHEQAAQVCGVELGDNELAPAHGSGAAVSGAAAIPGGAVGGVQTPSGGLVHALNKPGVPVPHTTVNVPVLSIPVPRKKRAAAAAAKLHGAHAAKPAGAQFKPSQDTPHLSRVFAQSDHSHGGTDFSALVSEMKEKLIEPPPPEEAEDDDSATSEPEEVTTPVATHMARVPSSNGGAQRSGARGGYFNLMRPQSRKGPGDQSSPAQQQQQQSRRARRAAAAAAAATSTDALPTTVEEPEAQHDLSPHTVASNNAPSLTSDSDDDDDEYSSGSSTGPSSHGSDAESDDHVDVDVEVEELDSRERGGADDHVHSHRAAHHADALPADKSDPELQASGRAKSKAQRRAAAAISAAVVAGAVAAAPVRQAVTKSEAPRKRGRPRKVQSK